MEESRSIKTVTFLTKTAFIVWSLNIGLSLRERKQRCDQWKRRSNISTRVGAEAQRWHRLSIADNYDLFNGSMSAALTQIGSQVL